MTRDYFIGQARRFAERSCITLFETKGRDYEGNAMFSGLRATARELSLSEKQVWYVFFKKHVDAIAHYCAGAELRSEPIESRIADAINHLLILAGMHDFFMPTSALTCLSDEEKV